MPNHPDDPEPKTIKIPPPQSFDELYIPEAAKALKYFQTLKPHPIKFSMDTETYKVSVNPAWEDFKAMASPQSATQKAMEKAEMKSWYDLLDQYPANQTAKTKVSDRLCVVTGPHPGTISSQWAWHDPYWVHKGNACFFHDLMKEDFKTGKFMPQNLMGRLIGTLQYTSEKWLEENGYVEMQSPFSGQWALKDECFEYYSVSEPKPYLAHKSLSNHYLECPVTSKRHPNGEFAHVFVTEDAEDTKKISLSGIAQSGTILRCEHCGDHWMKPLIKIIKLPGKSNSTSTCVRCENKYMEKMVIRSHDDSSYLPEMPDIITRVLKGKVVKEPNIRQYGVEIEVGFNKGSRVTTAVSVWNAIGRDFCYIKHDGSITKTEFEDGYKVKNPMKMGFEVVTAPAGINVHRERWLRLKDAAYFGNLRAWDADSCGMHVHVSRVSLSWFQIGRILVFMNHINNRYFVDVVAGRSSSFYTRYIKKDFTDCAKVDDCKYMAIRTNKPSSIEFRIFRSTVNYDHIIRNLEFVDAVCDFCAPCAASLQDMMDFRKFIAFVGRNQKQYPRLAKWLASIDMIAKKPLPDPKFASHVPVEEGLSDIVREQMKLAMPTLKSSKSLDELYGGAPPLPPQDKQQDLGDIFEEEGDEDIPE